MAIFPLDTIRNAAIDRDIELVLEDLREEVAGFPSWSNTGFEVADVLEVYDQARPRLNVVVSLLQDLGGSTGADIGTGLGFLPVLLARYGLHAMATDRDVTTSRFARDHGVEVRSYDIGHEAPPFPPGSLDFVILAEVLEHLKVSPVMALRDLAALLRPGGRFLLTTPNIARLQHLEALLAGENFLEPFSEHLPAGSDPTDFVEHVREYSIREIVEATEAVGLVVDRVLMTGWGEAAYNPLPNPYINEICVVLAHT